MKKDKSTILITEKSKNLELRIYNFKAKIINKEQFLKIEKNYFDKILDKSLIIIKKIILFLVDKLNLKKLSLSTIKMIKKTISEILNRLLKTNETYSNSKLFSKTLQDQQKIIQQNLKENLELKKDINKINSSLNELLKNPDKFFDNNTKNIAHNSIARVDFYQEENTRLGSELVDIKKKFEILKKEVEKYQEQKSNLISKINSVNEALNDTNVLTNVFENNISPKINIVDHNKISKKVNTNLNEQVKNIFKSN